MKRYNIYYAQYNPTVNNFVPYIRTVKTDDIYHEIGKMVCNSFETLRHITYTEPSTSHTQCERIWAEIGYRKVDKNLWVKDND